MLPPSYAALRGSITVQDLTATNHACVTLQQRPPATAGRDCSLVGGLEKGCSMAAPTDSTVMLGPLMDRLQEEVLGPERFIHSGALRFRRPGDGVDQRLVFWVERHSRFAGGRHLLGLRVEVAFTGAAKLLLTSMQQADQRPVVAIGIDVLVSAVGFRHGVWSF